MAQTQTIEFLKSRYSSLKESYEHTSDCYHEAQERVHELEAGLKNAKITADRLLSESDEVQKEMRVFEAMLDEHGIQHWNL
jgi:chromosome segregation ATPase